MKIRMHPSVILENVIASLGFVVIIFIYLVSSIFENIEAKDFEDLNKLIHDIPSMGIILGLGLFVAILLIFAIYFFFRWYNTSVYFEKDNFIIQTGKMFKKKTTIRLKEVAAVNIKQNILEKLLKTSNMKIVLNTNDENNYRGKLVFKAKDTLKIKSKILDKEEIKDDFSSLINFTLIDVLKHIFLNTNIFSLIIVVLIYIPIILSFLNDFSFQNFIMIIIVTVIFIYSIFGTIIKAILNYYNFKVNRVDNNIKISHGLLTTYKYNIPITKINCVLVKRSLQAKLFKYYLVEVVNAGMNETETEKTIISLYVKEEKLSFIFQNLLPEYQNNTSLKSQPKEAFITYLISKIPLIIFVIILSFINILLLLLIPLIVLIAFIQYKTQKIGVDNKFVILKKGLMEEVITILNFEKIELVAFKKGICSSLTNLWKVRLNIIGNLANSSFVSGYFNKEEMQKIEINY